jgi:hypothetical protein
MKSSADGSGSVCSRLHEKGSPICASRCHEHRERDGDAQRRDFRDFSYTDLRKRVRDVRAEPDRTLCQPAASDHPGHRQRLRQCRFSRGCRSNGSPRISLRTRVGVARSSTAISAKPSRSACLCSRGATITSAILHREPPAIVNPVQQQNLLFLLKVFIYGFALST